MKTLIKNSLIVNEGEVFKGSLLIDGKIISAIFRDNETLTEADKIIEAEGLIMMPGLIDDQVHFREPGNTHKGDIESESAAAVIGGVTSFMEMPNTNPPATTLALLENKYRIASQTSFANYSFYLGGTNENFHEIEQADRSKICGLKLFLGSSTGNMLVDDQKALDLIFSKSKMLIAIHSEDENIIKANLISAVEMYGEEIPFSLHPVIRSREACIESTAKAINLAIKHNSSLHILHISTKEEVEMIKNARRINPNITGEVCVHYMVMDDKMYCDYGSKMKCNPAIKSKSDRDAIIEAVKEGTINIVATDHAPHTIDEKNNRYNAAPSGLPLIQHSFQIMWELHLKGLFSITDIADRMAHSPARRFRIEKRGFIKEGFFADIMIFSPNQPTKVDKNNIKYKCGWSPFEGTTFNSSIIHTFINGVHAVSNGELTGLKAGERLIFTYE